MGAQLDRLHHEKFAKELFVLAGGHFKRLDEHTIRQSFNVLVKQGVIAKDQLGRKVRQAVRIVDQSSLTGNRSCDFEVRQAQRADI